MTTTAITNVTAMTTKMTRRRRRRRPPTTTTTTTTTTTIEYSYDSYVSSFIEIVHVTRTYLFQFVMT